MITFNSNVAVDATIKGIPIIVGYNSVGYFWDGNRKIKDLLEDKLEAPTPQQVNKFLRFLSYNQFTLEEFRQGIPWKIINTN